MWIKPFWSNSCIFATNLCWRCAHRSGGVSRSLPPSSSPRRSTPCGRLPQRHGWLSWALLQGALTSATFPALQILDHHFVACSDPINPAPLNSHHSMEGSRGRTVDSWEHEGLLVLLSASPAPLCCHFKKRLHLPSLWIYDPSPPSTLPGKVSIYLFYHFSVFSFQCQVPAS